MMSENQFKIGDVVRLKSGGVPMTITYIDRNDDECMAMCEWQNFASEEICHYKVTADALEKCDPGVFAAK